MFDGPMHCPPPEHRAVLPRIAARPGHRSLFDRGVQELNLIETFIARAQMEAVSMSIFIRCTEEKDAD